MRWYSPDASDPQALRQMVGLFSDAFIAFTAFAADQAVGSLAGHVLHKLAFERIDVSIDDQAVAEDFRRQGLATELVEAIKVIAPHRGSQDDVLRFDILLSPGAV